MTISPLRDGTVTTEVYLGRTEDRSTQRWRWDVTVCRHGIHQYTDFGYTFLRLTALWRIGQSLAEVQRRWSSAALAEPPAG